MPRLLGPEHPDPVALTAMRAKPLEPGQRWAVYQNQDLGHFDVGRLSFLKVGPGCTHTTPPDRCPDGPNIGPGWRYLHVGYVDLASGIVVDSPD